MSLENHLLPCLSKTLFGFECLGCGLQRSFVFLIQGEFWNAFKMYPAIYTLFAFVIFVIFNWLHKVENAKKIISKLAYLNLIVIILNYFLKTTI